VACWYVLFVKATLFETSKDGAPLNFFQVALKDFSFVDKEKKKSTND
jgi:hypothetical protein